jgi:hypothetical protein
MDGNHRQIAMRRSGPAFVAKVTIPAEAAYMWCFVKGKDETQQDDNAGSLWDTYFYGANGSLVQGSLEEQARMIQSGKIRAGEMESRVSALLEEELRSFPSNGSAWAALWGLRYTSAHQSLEAKKEITAEIMHLFNAHNDEPWAYKAAVLGLNRLQSNTEATDIVREFVRRYPEDSSMDALVVNILFNYAKLDDLQSLAALSKRWEHDRSYRETMLRAYGNNNATPEVIERAGLELIRLVPKEKDQGGETRYEVAELWLAMVSIQKPRRR